MTVRLAAFIALCTAGFSQDESTTLLGKWRSVETSKGGIGAVVDFHADGTFDYMPGAVLGGHYRVDGKQVIISLENGEPESSEILHSLSVTKMQLGMLDYERVGKPETADNLLLGVWRTVRTMPSAPGRHGYIDSCVGFGQSDVCRIRRENQASKRDKLDGTANFAFHHFGLHIGRCAAFFFAASNRSFKPVMLYPHGPLRDHP